MRRFIVDTTATVIFFTALAAFTELYFSEMNVEEVLITRTLMIPIMILTGRPYGIWRDWFISKLNPNKFLSRVIVDCVSFVSFQMPIYAATLFIVGVEVSETITLIFSATIAMVLVSRPFGLFLEKMRCWTKSD
ncbi:L-alanine exporter AlaE [Marinomonas atlantica]|uniref:L-alanine exporter AlaE n=1 Tax=Marinomonas atlantica TaxID=1806668 RepID=UPI00082F5D6E|nr:L-alanine exporter AlaE [Marinomonas atlantica]